MTAASVDASRSHRGSAGGVDAFLERRADRYWYYGSGKAALRDGLAALRRCGSGDVVLLPAYVPDALVEPIGELGLEAHHYAVTPGLEPDRTDFEARLDDGALAALSVDYFGFPQPGIDAFERSLEDAGCFHVEDAAHAGLSLDPADGSLLGTRGHVGIASFSKLLPIPNGAALYVPDRSVAEAFSPSTLAVPKTRFDAGDGRFLLGALAKSVLDGRPTASHLLEALSAGYGGDPGPVARYEASKSRLSALSRRVLETTSVGSIAATRRAIYRRWLAAFDGCERAEALFPSLPSGVCPQAFPVQTAESGRLRNDLRRWGVGGVYAWPRLPLAVREDPAYETARQLSREVLALPVDGGIDRATVDAVGRRLRGR